MRKNVAAQHIAGQLNSRTDGSPLTTTVSVLVTGDNGTQTAGGGTLTHKGNGHWNYAPTQAETNFNHIAFTFTHASGVHQTVNVYTVSFDPHNVTTLGLTNLDVAVSTRMATYTQPTGFLAATFPTGTVANTTNITAGTITTTTTATNVTTVNGLAASVITAASIATDAIQAAKIQAAALNGKGDWNIGKTGYSLVQAFPTNFSALSITAGGLVDITQAAADKVWSSATRTLTAFSTALALSIWDVLESAVVTASTMGLKVKNNLDAAITSRMATYTQPTGFLAATFPGTVASPTNITAATGIVLSGVTHTGAVIPTVSAVTGLTAANLDVAVSTRMATYTQPTGFLAATFPTGTIANTTNITAGTLTTVTTATNVTTLNGIAANVITAASINADAITAAKIADGAIDSATFAVETGLRPIRSGTAQAGAATTITLDASASAVDSFYNNTLVLLTGGTGVGQSRFISAYVGATKVATVATWGTNPDVTSTFAILPFDAVAGASAPTAAQNATAVWDRARASHVTAGTFGEGAASVQGNVTGSVATATNVTTVNGLAANVITAASIAADAIQAAKIQAAALNGKGDWNIGKTGYALTATTGLGNQTANITGNITGTITTATNVTTLNGIAANVITAASIAAAALNGKGDWNIGKTGYALAATGLDAIVSTATGMVEIAKAVWDRVLTGATHNIPTSAGKRLRQLGATTLESGTAQAGAANTITLRSGADATNNIYNGNLIALEGGTGVGQARIIVAYAGAGKVASVQRAWTVTPDATTEYVIIANGNPLRMFDGAVVAATASTVDLQTDTPAINGTLIGAKIVLYSGTGEGQSRIINAWDGTLKRGTLENNWVTTPDTTSTYVIFPLGRATVVSIQADAIDADSLKADAVTKIQAGLATPTNITAATGIVLSGVTHTGAVIPTVTTATNVTTVNGLAANVITAASINAGAITNAKFAASAIDAAAIATDAITAGKIAANAITAAKIATDAIGAAQLAADAVTEIQAGLATPAQVNAEVVDALNVDTYGEPGQATPAATATLAGKIGFLYKAWRNRTTQSASQYSLYNDDATTLAQKATFSDDGTTADRGEVGTGP